MCLVLRRLANVGRGFLSWWRVGRWVLARAAEPTVLQVRLRVWWWVPASGTNPASTFGPGIRHHLTRPASCFVVLHRWSGASKRKKKRMRPRKVARRGRGAMNTCFFLSYLLFFSIFSFGNWSLDTYIAEHEHPEEEGRGRGPEGGRRREEREEGIFPPPPPTQQNWVCDVGG